MFYIENISKKLINDYYKLQIMELLCKNLGNDYCTIYDISNHIKNNIVLSARTYNEEKIIGIAISQKINNNQNKKFSNYININDNIGYIESIVVNENFRKKGIGNKLLEKSIKELQKENINCILTEAWIHPDDNLCNLLEKYNFNKIKELKKYYQETHCPYCGNNCTCDAILYKLEL